jgi:transposase
MPAPYSEDLRLRVIDALRRGMTYEQATHTFRVSNSTILRWVRRLRESGSYAALPMGGKKPFVLAEQRDWLLQRLETEPNLTLRELLAELHDRGIEVSYFALWHIVRRAGLRFKKRPSAPARKIAPTWHPTDPGSIDSRTG